MRFCYSCMNQIPDSGSTTVCPICGNRLEMTCDTSRFLKPGTVLQGKFVVGKVLGSGGFGNTYLGWNQLLQCKVAIKEYFPRQISFRSPEEGTVSVTDTSNQNRFHSGLRQFLEEARSIASMQNIKGIIQIFSFFEEYGTGYFVMEYLDGMDVKQILKRRGGTMNYEDARRVVLTVLHTLREIHGHGILHRDIAPDNVYVTKDGVIKLIDFGAAKHEADFASKQGELMLKPGYAPPEQYSRQAKQGVYTDLYAVAALFYHLLSGAKPQAANERMVDDQVKALSELGVSLPEEAEGAIMFCLNLEPQFRLQSAEEFMEALHGRDFVPVYEAEWIVPEVEEKPETLIEKIKYRTKDWNPIAKVGVLAACVAVAVAIVSVGVRAAYSSTRVEQVQVDDNGLPACEGESEESALKMLDGAKVTNIKIKYTYGEENDTPMVISQDPPAGATIEDKMPVKLVVSNKEKVTIPDYYKQDVKKIESSLQNLLGNQYDKIKDKVFHYDYEKRPAGTCYKQNITDKDVRLDNLDRLKVMISWGTMESYKKKLPGLTGMTMKEAKDSFTKDGWKFHLEKAGTKVSSTIPEGAIVQQKPAAGLKINSNAADKKHYKGDMTIKVWISSGPPVVVTAKPSTNQDSGYSSGSGSSSSSSSSNSGSSSGSKSSGGSGSSGGSSSGNSGKSSGGGGGGLSGTWGGGSDGGGLSGDWD